MYDPLPSDEPLLQGLFRQEILRAEGRLPGSVVTLLFEIVCAFDSPEHPIAVKAFTRGKREILLLPSGQLSRQLAEAAEKAAIMMGDKAALAQVRNIFSRE